MSDGEDLVPGANAGAEERRDEGGGATPDWQGVPGADVFGEPFGEWILQEETRQGARRFKERLSPIQCERRHERVLSVD
jgi:hypothetical protein